MMHRGQFQPPGLALAILRLLAVQEHILGDFVEEFESVSLRNGRLRAKIWFWQQLFRSMPAMCQRRWQTIMATLTRREKQLLILSFFSLIPAMLIGIPGLLFSVFGLAKPMNAIFGFLGGNIWLSWVIHPLVIIGGVGLALLLTAWPVIRLGEGNSQGRLLIFRKGYWLHLLVLATAVFFILLIFTYLLAENFHIFALVA